MKLPLMGGTGEERGSVVEMRSKRIALDKLFKRRDRYEIPDWQRGEVWSPDSQRKLIDSILCGWKLPKFYFQKTSSGPDEYDVVDGQQRLSTIWGFFDDEVILEDDARLRYGGTTYSELSDAYSDAFDDFEIEFDEITEATDKEVREFFQRLQKGLPLTSSEKLNSINSKLRDFCSAISKDAFFSETTGVVNRRFAFFDICAKVMVVELEDLDAGLRFEEIRRVFEDNAGYSSASASAKRVRAALKLLHGSFPPSDSSLRQRSLVQSLITLTCHLQRVGMTPAQGKELVTFFHSFHAELLRQVEHGLEATDPDFIAFQKTVNANTRAGARVRHEVLLRKLFLSHPDFFGASVDSKDLASTLGHEVERSASEIVGLIEKINNRYSSVHGGDLFKPTNRTATTLARLATRVGGYDEYKTFVDDLYFVFREGPGQRLSDSVPASFADANDLRTVLHHDVDHGKAGASSARRKKLGATFAKYAGAPTPDAASPGQLLLAQANILSALVADLRILARDLV